MEFVKATKTRKRMCIECRGNHCRTCPMSGASREKRTDCDSFIMNYPREAEKIIEQWDKENPEKTYAKDFFEKFPNALKCENGLPQVCWSSVYGFECPFGDSSGERDCEVCWRAAYKED